MTSCCRYCFCNYEEEAEFEEEKCDGQAPEASTNDVMINVSAHTGNVVYYEDDTEFNDLLKQAEVAIENEILPVMIAQGSSGSYFVKNTEHENIGIFKPRDEEPYGRLNPKWAKWFQRRCCPCCFGRGCLLLNSGYLSEAGASLVDHKLHLHVVPNTRVIRMASTTFHYGKIKREVAKARKTLADKFPAVGRRFHRIGLPLKVGSFQTFVKGYKDAIEWIQHFEANPLPEDIAYEFQLEFEKLVILDYTIRNTDRGNDNWLIRYDKDGGGKGGDAEMTLTPFSLALENGLRMRIKIAAIDNGLAFPFKHPDQWRAYPFQWAKFPFAKVPFSSETRNKYLPILSNAGIIEELCADLYCLFRMDKKFHKHIFDKQMSVMRGQILNLVSALRDGRSPLQLVHMPPVIVLKNVDYPEVPGKIQSITHTHVRFSSGSAKDNPNSSGVSHPASTYSTRQIFSDISDDYSPEYQQEVPIFSSW